jgi:hypothetical protein
MRLRPYLPSSACLAALVCAGAPAEARGVAEEAYRNLSAGGALRHGVYGRIAVRGAPPPVVFAQPVIARRELGPVQAKPSYLYVPSGQVRRWSQHCAKWQACTEPVLFVRMEGSPGRWGQWRELRATGADGAD